MKALVMVYGETEKGKRWLMDNIQTTPLKNKTMGPSVVTRTFQTELLNDLIEEFKKAGLTLDE
jgi:hypothetical protein